MLDFMKTSQLAAFYLGLIFSILTIATTLLAFKYAKRLNSFAKTLALTLIVPMISVVCWLYLVLSFVDTLRKNEALCIIISILLTLFIFGMIIIVSKALYAKHGEDLELADGVKSEKKKANKTEKTEAAQENKDEFVAASPLLLAHTSDNAAENEEAVENEEVAEESVVETQELKEEEPEEVEEETEETDEALESEEVEETEDEEVEEDEEDTDEILIADEEENDSENQDETQSEDDEEDDDDEDFDKFIEELKSKLKEKSGDNQDNE